MTKEETALNRVSEEYNIPREELRTGKSYQDEVRVFAPGRGEAWLVCIDKGGSRWCTRDRYTYTTFAKPHLVCPRCKEEDIKYVPKSCGIYRHKCPHCGYTHKLYVQYHLSFSSFTTDVTDNDINEFIRGGRT